jgi:hypothetical protein
VLVDLDQTTYQGSELLVLSEMVWRVTPQQLLQQELGGLRASRAALRLPRPAVAPAD